MSSPTSLVVIGGGEHARVVIDAAQSRPEEWTVVGYCDPAACDETSLRFGVPWLGDDGAAFTRLPADIRFVLGIGGRGPSPKRREVVARFAALGARWATVVHAAAIVSPSAALAEGVVIFAGAVVNSGARVGAHAIVNTGAVVEHDVRIGELATIGPRAVLGGGVSIGAGAFIGLGSAVRDHTSVGIDAIVGMGAVVVSDVADRVRVVGVPAR